MATLLICKSVGPRQAILRGGRARTIPSRRQNEVERGAMGRPLGAVQAYREGLFRDTHWEGLAERSWRPRAGPVTDSQGSQRNGGQGGAELQEEKKKHLTNDSVC